MLIPSPIAYERKFPPNNQLCFSFPLWMRMREFNVFTMQHAQLWLFQRKVPGLKLCFLQDLSTSKSPKLVYGSEHLALGGIRVEYVKVASVVWGSIGWPNFKMFGCISSAYQGNAGTPLPSFAIDLHQNPKSFKPSKIFLTMAFESTERILMD